MYAESQNLGGLQFTAAHRSFEPVTEGLKTDDVKVQCASGMMSTAVNCGGFISDIK